VPSNTVKRVVQQLQEKGRVSYPYLGVSIDNHFTTGELASALNLPVAKGVVISAVVDGGPAERAGLKGGDRQVAVRASPSGQAATSSPPSTVRPSTALTK